MDIPRMRMARLLVHGTNGRKIHDLVVVHDILWYGCDDDDDLGRRIHDRQVFYRTCRHGGGCYIPVLFCYDFVFYMVV